MHVTSKRYKFSSPEFSLFTNAPESIIDCIQAVEPEPDGFMRYAYALDDSGTAWQWYAGVSCDPSGLIMLACIVIFGAIAGMLAGIVMSPVGVFIGVFKKEEPPSTA